mmetsp:Transcript_146664/g.365723  ORF Transcript_146664/g.365723 Transcript_146664/m.365723 type:complete len:226 (+) Transcript_146664:990-1667(+)
MCIVHLDACRICVNDGAIVSLSTGGSNNQSCADCRGTLASLGVFIFGLSPRQCGGGPALVSEELLLSIHLRRFGSSLSLHGEAQAVLHCGGGICRCSLRRGLGQHMLLLECRDLVPPLLLKTQATHPPRWLAAVALQDHFPLLDDLAATVTCARLISNHGFQLVVSVRTTTPLRRSGIILVGLVWVLDRQALHDPAIDLHVETVNDICGDHDDTFIRPDFPIRNK